MKVPPKPIKIYYKLWSKLLSDPTNKYICLAVICSFLTSVVFQVIRSVFFL